MSVREANVSLGGLENRQPFTGLVSSNLTLSATQSEANRQIAAGPREWRLFGAFWG